MYIMHLVVFFSRFFLKNIIFFTIFYYAKQFGFRPAVRKEHWITLVSVYAVGHTTPDRWQSKMLILSTNVDKKSLETGDW